MNPNPALGTAATLTSIAMIGSAAWFLPALVTYAWLTSFTGPLRYPRAA